MQPELGDPEGTCDAVLAPKTWAEPSHKPSEYHLCKKLEAFPSPFSFLLVFSYVLVIYFIFYPSTLLAPPHSVRGEFIDIIGHKSTLHTCQSHKPTFWRVYSHVFSHKTCHRAWLPQNTPGRRCSSDLAGARLNQLHFVFWWHCKLLGQGCSLGEEWAKWCAAPLFEGLAVPIFFYRSKPNTRLKWPQVGEKGEYWELGCRQDSKQPLFFLWCLFLEFLLEVWVLLAQLLHLQD